MVHGSDSDAEKLDEALADAPEVLRQVENA